MNGGKSTRLLRGTNANTPHVGKCRRTQIHLSSFASHPREKQAFAAPGEVADRRFFDPFGSKAACGNTSGVGSRNAMSPEGYKQKRVTSSSSQRSGLA
jgi:hypothetical protein